MIKLVATASHSLILTADGKTYGLGDNYSAALGVASNQLSYPVPQAILDNVRMVAVADNQSYFLRRDGTLWGTGATKGGMLGEYYPGAGSVVPFPLVPNRTNITAIWANGLSGQGGCIFLTRDGDLFLLGGPSDYEPRKLASDVIDAAVGAGFTLWVHADGSLWSYGTNTFGQLGNGTTDCLPCGLSCAIVWVFRARCALTRYWNGGAQNRRSHADCVFVFACLLVISLFCLDL